MPRFKGNNWFCLPLRNRSAVTLGVLAATCSMAHAHGVAVSSLIAVADRQAVIYVDADATGLADGSSWADAFIDLQDALDVAQAGDEIWVAEGVYKPDRGTGDRGMSFEMVCGASIYGGFAGDETCRDERDWNKHRTVLSGDLNGDDGLLNCDQSSNCCVAHESPGCDDAECEALVCRFGGEHCCDPLDISGWNGNCALEARVTCCHLGDWNTCDNTRHVVSVIGCEEPTVVDGLTVLGGYHVWTREPEEFNGFFGSGVFIDTSTVAVQNCQFEGSYSADIWDDSRVSLQPKSTIRITSSMFDHEGPGRAIETNNADVMIEDCDFLRNSSLTLSSFDTADHRVHTLQDSRFIGVSTGVGGDATIKRCLFKEGGGLRLSDGTSVVTDSFFAGNWRHLNVVSGSAIVESCLFVGSTSQTVTGGAGSILLNNCALLNNSPFSAAVRWGQGTALLLNTTIVGNGLLRNTRSGGIELQAPSSAQVLNSIIWGNGSGAQGDTREQDQIYLQDDRVSFEIDYSIVEGWSGKCGGPGNTGNFGLDPMFADLDGPDDIPGTLDDNARLLPSSPAINAGLGTSQYQLPTDIDGHHRVLCGAVDIGAYEFGFGDFNCDQTTNMIDFAMWPFCMTGPASGNPASSEAGMARPTNLLPGCEAFDANGDDDVDLADFPAVGDALAH